MNTMTNLNLQRYKRIRAHTKNKTLHNNVKKPQIIMFLLPFFPTYFSIQKKCVIYLDIQKSNTISDIVYNTIKMSMNFANFVKGKSP